MSQMQGFQATSRRLATSTPLDVSIVDATGAQVTTLPVSGPLTDAELRASPVSVTEDPFSSVVTGQTNVTTAGTRVALGASTAILGVVIRAKLTNTGLIYVGNSSVTSSNGYILDRGSAVTVNVDNLADISIDSSVSGEGVSYMAAIA